jgi:hypothetical protein
MTARVSSLLEYQYSTACPPTLEALADQAGNLYAYCDWCKHFHTHSGSEGGHRVAHCWNGPYRETGYILKVTGRWTEQHAREARNLKRRAWRKYVAAELLQAGFR